MPTARGTTFAPFGTTDWEKFGTVTLEQLLDYYDTIAQSTCGMQYLEPLSLAADTLTSDFERADLDGSPHTHARSLPRSTALTQSYRLLVTGNGALDIHENLLRQSYIRPHKLTQFDECHNLKGNGRTSLVQQHQAVSYVYELRAETSKPSCTVELTEGEHILTTTKFTSHEDGSFSILDFARHMPKSWSDDVTDWDDYTGLYYGPECANKHRPCGCLNTYGCSPECCADHERCGSQSNCQCECLFPGGGYAWFLAEGKEACGAVLTGDCDKVVIGADFTKHLDPGGVQYHYGCLDWGAPENVVVDNGRSKSYGNEVGPDSSDYHFGFARGYGANMFWPLYDKKGCRKPSEGKECADGHQFAPQRGDGKEVCGQVCGINVTLRKDVTPLPTKANCTVPCRPVPGQIPKCDLAGGHFWRFKPRKCGEEDEKKCLNENKPIIGDLSKAWTLCGKLRECDSITRTSPTGPNTEYYLRMSTDPIDLWDTMGNTAIYTCLEHPFALGKSNASFPGAICPQDYIPIDEARQCNYAIREINRTALVGGKSITSKTSTDACYYRGRDQGQEGARSYRGTANQTEDGYPCSPWATIASWDTKPDKFPSENADIDNLQSNYCRAPDSTTLAKQDDTVVDGRFTPWCYVCPDWGKGETCKIHACAVPNCEDWGSVQTAADTAIVQDPNPNWGLDRPTGCFLEMSKEGLPVAYHNAISPKAPTEGSKCYDFDHREGGKSALYKCPAQAVCMDPSLAAASDFIEDAFCVVQLFKQGDGKLELIGAKGFGPGQHSVIFRSQGSMEENIAAIEVGPGCDFVVVGNADGDVDSDHKCGGQGSSDKFCKGCSAFDFSWAENAQLFPGSTTFSSNTCKRLNGAKCDKFGDDLTGDVCGIYVKSKAAGINTVVCWDRDAIPPFCCNSLYPAKDPTTNEPYSVATVNWDKDQCIHAKIGPKIGKWVGIIVGTIVVGFVIKGGRWAYLKRANKYGGLGRRSLVEALEASGSISRKEGEHMLSQISRESTISVSEMTQYDFDMIQQVIEENLGPDMVENQPAVVQATASQKFRFENFIKAYEQKGLLPRKYGGWKM